MIRISLVACILIAATAAVSCRYYFLANKRAQNAIVKAVDLSDAGTIRGSSDSRVLQKITLPQGIVQLTLLLPAFSEGGQYTIAVSRTLPNPDTVVKTKGIATAVGSQTRIDVMLDLRTVSCGRYLLVTTHGNDASYYYDLKIE